MQANKTVTINGRVYDAVTGLPVERPQTAVKKKPAARPVQPSKRPGTASNAVHSSTQRSQTLHRRAAKKPTPIKRPEPGRHMDIARSSKIARFAPHPVAAPPKHTKETPDAPPRQHPAAQRALARHTEARVTSQAIPTTKQVKEAAISAALATPTPKPAKPKRLRWRWSRRVTVISGILLALIAGAYLVYMNVPSISVGFAANQAGIKASYPKYVPDGYHLQQPVTFRDGEVTLEFASNSGGGGYDIIQSRSLWDSSAVLDNVVRAAAGDNYVTTRERGLTIYSYDNSALWVWVNGGILYTIRSEAPLSVEQIRRIATSL